MPWPSPTWYLSAVARRLRQRPALAIGLLIGDGDIYCDPLVNIADVFEFDDCLFVVFFRVIELSELAPDLPDDDEIHAACPSVI